MSDDSNKEKTVAINELLSQLRDAASNVLTSELDAANLSEKERLLLFFKQQAKTSAGGTVTLSRVRTKRCSFCKSTIADRFVEGRDGVLICADCVDQCIALLNEDDVD